MTNICKLCNKESPTLGGLHLHIQKTHSVNQKSYYEKFYPRHDLYSGRQIPYKNFDDYKDRLFLDKKSEFAYLRAANFSERAREILLNQLNEMHFKSKGRLPTYCEWRSSKNLRYDFMRRAGFLDNFLSLALNSNFSIPFSYDATLPLINRVELPVLTDTREQKPLFSGEKTTINVGDYTLSKEHYNGIHIDRKSKADFIQTFTAGFDRFKKECEKAKSLDVTLVVLVEAPFTDCFRYRPLKFTRQVVTGENAFNGVRRISREFNNVQFLFVNDRVEAKKYINLILNNKQIVNNFDLQFVYETGEFK